MAFLCHHVQCRLPTFVRGLDICIAFGNYHSHRGLGLQVQCRHSVRGLDVDIDTLRTCVVVMRPFLASGCLPSVRCHCRSHHSRPPTACCRSREEKVEAQFSALAPTFGRPLSPDQNPLSLSSSAISFALAEGMADPVLTTVRTCVWVTNRRGLSRFATVFSHACAHSLPSSPRYPAALSHTVAFWHLLLFPSVIVHRRTSAALAILQLCYFAVFSNLPSRSTEGDAGIHNLTTSVSGRKPP